MSIKTGPDKVAGLEVIPAGTTIREIIKSKTSTSVSNVSFNEVYISGVPVRQDCSCFVGVYMLKEPVCWIMNMLQFAACML